MATAVYLESEERWKIVTDENGNCWIVPPGTIEGDVHNYFFGETDGLCPQCHKQADFVVKACNNHKALVEALKNARENLKLMVSEKILEYYNFREIDAAIAQTEE
jgi:hypothetical protein